MGNRLLSMTCERLTGRLVDHLALHSRVVVPGLHRIWTCLCLFLFLILASTVTLAHELRPAVAELNFSDDGLDISLLINLEAVMSEVGPEHDDTDDSPNAEEYDRLRSMAPTGLEDKLQKYLPTLLSRIRLVDGAGGMNEARFELESVSIPEVGDTRLPRDSVLNLQFVLDESVSAVSWQWDSRYGPIILRVAEKQGEEAFSQYLQSGQLSEPIAVANREARSGWSVFGEYVVVGFEHIIPKGLDHILFVIGLFLLSPYWKPIAWQVTVFTLAHTVTLALSTFDLIAIPADIVEPLIALSITAVCIENVFRSNFQSSRIVLVFLFGLLHGLGFASVLGEAGLSEGQFLTSLFGFNLGVEFGQFVVILLCFLLVGWWFRARSWYRRRFSIPASIAIGAIGLYWFVTRLAG